MNIFIAKLNYKTKEDTLIRAFEFYGEVKSAKIVKDRETGRSKGYGFVEMSSDKEAKNAIDGLDGSDVDGFAIVVKPAEPRK